MPESRGEWAAFVAGLALVAGLLFVGVRGMHHPHAASPAGRSTPSPVEGPAATTSTLPATTTQQTRSTTSTARSTSRRRTATTPAAQAVVLMLAARGASTWVEVREGDANGRMLFTGTLAPGTKKAFRAGGPLWARFGGAANLVVALNGRSLHVPTGTYDVMFDATGFRLLG